MNDCIDNAPYVYRIIQVPEVLASATTLYQPTTEKTESYFSLSDENKKMVDAEVDAVYIILTGIDNDIYSTVDACANAKEITNNTMQTQTSNALHNAIMEAGSKDRPLMLAPNLPYEYTWADKAVPVTKGSSETTTERYMDNYKNVSQDIRDQLNAKAEAIQIILTGIDNYIYSTVDAYHNKLLPETGKAIVNSPPSIYDQEPFMVAEDDEMSKDKEIDKLMALISLSFKKIYKPTNNNLRTSSNTSRANQDNSPRIGRSTGHVARECQKPKRAKDAAYHKEKMLLCKQEEARFQLNVEQADLKDNIDDELEDRELEAHYMYMAQIQEVTSDAVDNSGPVFDTEPLQKELFAHQETISIMSQQKEAQIKFYKTCEDKEIDKVIALENKVNVLDNIVYKTGQSVQTMNMLNRNCKRVLPNLSSLRKLKERILVWNTKCQSIFEIENIQRDINTIVTGVVLCKQKMANPTWYGHVEPVIKNTIEKKINPVISRINVGLHMFLKRLNEEMVADLRYFNSLESEVDSLTSQLETQKTQFVNEIDRLSREYFYADHMNAILGIYTELDEVTNMKCDYLELLQKCECLETELSKSKKMSKKF
nr:hypothetical protein [Tanacetum cinerariifolium]GEV08396.1 hypothetical protein [Tanacetum cinerariifolium]